MLKIIILAMSFLTINLYASEGALPNCRISSIKDAKKCIDKLVLIKTSYEEPNEGIVSENKTALLSALKSIGVDKRILRQVKEADFVGAILEHGDEHQIYYYTFTKDNGIAELCELSVTDFEYSLVHTTHVNNFFLGLDAKMFDVYEDVVYALKEFENKN